MAKFKFDKLVRDKIVEQQISSGAKAQYHKLNDQQHKEALVNKIIEEAREILQADQSEVASEIADVQQAIDDLKLKFGLASSVIAEVQQAKNNKNGSFAKGIYVDHVELANDDKWTKYYRQNPDRYPEID
jgi:predicted house-cleaning noncanonical NTP pyrophosphatase (MazG superfamily)